MVGEETMDARERAEDVEGGVENVVRDVFDRLVADVRARGRGGVRLGFRDARRAMV